MVNTGILLSDDLIFSSRVTGTARDHGATFRVVRTIDAVLGAAASETPNCVIVDLSLVGDRLEELLQGIKSLAEPPRIVAYGSHVDTALLRAASEAGCDIVLPRSQFVDRLPLELPAWIAPRN